MQNGRGRPDPKRGFKKKKPSLVRCDGSEGWEVNSLRSGSEAGAIVIQHDRVAQLGMLCGLLAIEDSGQAQQRG